MLYSRGMTDYVGFGILCSPKPMSGTMDELLIIATRRYFQQFFSATTSGLKNSYRPSSRAGSLFLAFPLVSAVEE